MTGSYRAARALAHWLDRRHMTRLAGLVIAAIWKREGRT